MPVNRGTLVAAGVLTLLSGAIYAGIYLLVPGFEELFRGFGAELPLLTRIVAATFPYFGVLVLLGLIPTAWLFRQREISAKQRDRVMILSVSNLVLAFGLLALCWAALYLPVLKMGTAVE